MAGTEIPQCNGCHFRCALDSYQCSKGQRIFSIWNDTGDMPQPGPKGKNQKHPNNSGPHGSEHLGFLFNVIPMILAKKSGSGELDSLMNMMSKHEGGLTANILKSELGINEAGYEYIVAQATEMGYIAQDEDAPHFICLTDAGHAFAEERKAQKNASNEDFFSVLDAEEQAQLEDLLAKLRIRNLKRR